MTNQSILTGKPKQIQRLNLTRSKSLTVNFSIHFCLLLPLWQLAVAVNFLSSWGRKISKQNPRQSSFHSPMHWKSSYQNNLFKARIQSLQLKILATSSYQPKSLPGIFWVAPFHYPIPYGFWLHWLKLGHLGDKYFKIFLSASIQCCFCRVGQ